MAEAALAEKPSPTADKPAADAAELERKKREAEIKKRGAELKSQRDALEKEKAQLKAEREAAAKEKAEVDEFKKWRSQATLDPDAFLTPVYGKDWRDTLAKATAGDTTPLAVKQLRDEIDRKEKERAEKESKAEQDRKAKEEADKKSAQDEDEKVFSDYRTHITTEWIKEHGDKFPTLVSTGLVEQIAFRARALFHETGKMPAEEEVAKELEEKLDKIIEGVYSTKKWEEKLTAKFKPQTTPVARAKEAPTFQVKPRVQSISQQMTAGAKPPDKPLTREQRKAMLRSLSDEDWNKKADAARGIKVAADE